jgi:MFS family permease
MASTEAGTQSATPNREQQPEGQNREIETDLPARMDRLPWSRWHMRIITALGTSWLLDGLEVTLVGSLAGILSSKDGLSLTDPQVTAAATIYLAGAVLGALVFGHLTDRLGRKRLFLVTLATYSLATVCTAFTQDFLMFAVCRFFTGFGIGGEYAAINSAVDELIPSQVRGTVDLLVNGTFWVGATLGSLAALVLLNGKLLPLNTGWRYAFGIGGTLGLGVLLLRLGVPESPRWLMLRGKEDTAQKVVKEIEEDVQRSSGKNLPPPEGGKLKLTVRDHTPWGDIFGNMLGENRQRSILGLVLMAAQSFFFNAIFFTYALIGKQFYHVSDQQLPMQLLPFAVASFLGPLILGQLFDKVGRKPMITATYGISGVLLGAVCIPFAHGSLSLKAMGICFSVIFFVASSAASAAYLTVSEIFPLEIRAFAIAVFYALGTLVGGVGAPYLFGLLIASGSKTNVAFGYALGAVLMIGAAVLEGLIGVEAAGKGLESVSKPLQSR